MPWVPEGFFRGEAANAARRGRSGGGYLSIKFSFVQWFPRILFAQFASKIAKRASDVITQTDSDKQNRKLWKI